MLPDWLKKKVACGARQLEVEHLVQDNGLHTVCQEAFCPNKGDCFGKGVLTFQILGDICTRKCAFCGENTGRPGPLDSDEPERVAKVAAALNLKHVVITSPARDDLADGGASQFAATIQAIHEKLSRCSVEALAPDFQGSDSAIDIVINAEPDVFNHNIETVRRLQQEIRPKASYERSLYVLKHAAHQKSNNRLSPHPNPLPQGEGGVNEKVTPHPNLLLKHESASPPVPLGEGERKGIKNWVIIVKSGIMVGLGEETEELEQSFHDLAEAGIEILTIGQYLPPSLRHRQVSKFYSPDEFEVLRNLAQTSGIKHVYANPFMRSSYNAEQTFAAARPV